MTLQQLQSLDVPVSYASIMGALGDTPSALKISYVPSLVSTELECELDPATVRPVGKVVRLVKDKDPLSKLESSLLDCWEETLRRWMIGHASSHLNADVLLSVIGWYWMDDDLCFESEIVAHDMSCPKTRAFPYDYIVFRIYPKPTQKED